MRMPSVATRTGLALAVVLMVSAGPAARAQTLKEGSKVTEGSLPATALNNDGRRALTDFVGNVVLLDWWGNH